MLPLVRRPDGGKSSSSYNPENPDSDVLPKVKPPTLPLSKKFIFIMKL